MSTITVAMLAIYSHSAYPPQVSSLPPSCLYTLHTDIPHAFIYDPNLLLPPSTWVSSNPRCQKLPLPPSLQNVFVLILCFCGWLSFSKARTPTFPVCLLIGRQQVYRFCLLNTLWIQAFFTTELNLVTAFTLCFPTDSLQVRQIKKMFVLMN